MQNEYWAVKWPDGTLDETTLHPGEVQATHRFVESMSYAKDLDAAWKKYQEQGYKTVKVKIVEVEDAK